MGRIKDNITEAKEKMRARKIVECFSSNWTGDI